tara:strand:- start:553 stop:1521 length:969 start_codon:yes stop_codon:yes gene_type:complete
MGTAQSTGQQVNEHILNATTNQDCRCDASSVNIIGAVDLEIGSGCQVPSLTETNSAKVKCSCPMDAAIEELSTQMTTATQTLKQGFTTSFAINKTGDQLTKSDVTTTLNQLCNTDSSAKNVIQGVHVKTASCIGMTKEQLQVQKQASINLHNTSSAQAACIMKLGEQMTSSMAITANNKTKNDIFEGIGGFLYPALLGIAVVALFMLFKPHEVQEVQHTAAKGQYGYEQRRVPESQGAIATGVRLANESGQGTVSNPQQKNAVVPSGLPLPDPPHRVQGEVAEGHDSHPRADTVNQPAALDAAFQLVSGAANAYAARRRATK